MTAAGWGGLAAGALLVGALLGVYARVPRRVTALIMAFGAGVLLAAAAAELLPEAHDKGGTLVTSLGFAGGALAYTVATRFLDASGARHRKRSSGDAQTSEKEQEGSGTALLVGSLIDGIPESVAIGASLLGADARVSLATVAAAFLSNVPEGLSSSAGMIASGRSKGYVIGVWSAVVAVSALAAGLGYLLLGSAPGEALAGVLALAAGGVVAMVADTMIPEAFAETQDRVGLAVGAGFLVAFLLARAD